MSRWSSSSLPHDEATLAARDIVRASSVRLELEPENFPSVSRGAAPGGPRHLRAQPPAARRAPRDPLASMESRQAQLRAAREVKRRERETAQKRSAGPAASHSRTTAATSRTTAATAEAAPSAALLLEVEALREQMAEEEAARDAAAAEQAAVADELRSKLRQKSRLEEQLQRLQ